MNGTLEFNTKGSVKPEDYAWARKHLQEQGWVVIPDILTPEQADFVNERLWAAKEAGEKRGDKTHMQWLDPNDANVRVFYLLELDKVFRDLIEHPVAIDMVKAVLGEDLAISPQISQDRAPNPWLCIAIKASLFRTPGKKSGP